MSTPARKRLMYDFKKLMADPPSYFSGAPTDDDLMHWQAIMFGPPDTPFEYATLKLTIDFTEEFPNKPPIVKFVSRMFHPNVYADGSICLDILQQKWSPSYDVATVLASIQALLNEPNPDSPANHEAAKLFTENRKEYNKKVQQIVDESLLTFETNEGESEKKGDDEKRGTSDQTDQPEQGIVSVSDDEVPCIGSSAREC